MSQNTGRRRFAGSVSGKKKSRSARRSASGSARAGRGISREQAHLLSKKRTRMILRKRRRLLAGGIIAAAAVVCIVLLYACGVFYRKADTDTITFHDNGTVTFEEISSVEDGTDEDALKDYLKDQIRQYNASCGSRDVHLKRFTIRGKKAYVRTEYKDAETYEAFTGYETFSGTVKQAKAAGYTFDSSFVSVKKRKKQKSVSSENAMKNTKNRVAVVRENCTVRVSGSIRYISTDSTAVDSSRKVTVDSGGDTGDSPLVYIIYAAD